MKTIFHRVLQISLVAVLVLTSACALTSPPAQVAEPTPDLDKLKTEAVAEAIADQDELVNAARTEAVSTSVAAITEQAALNPTPTAALPTTAPVTNPTPTAKASATLPAVVPPVVVVTTVPGGVSPTKTPYTDACRVVSTSPSDYKVLTAGQDFDGTWVLKNTGMVTWTDGQYYIKYQSGTIPVEKDLYYIKGNVVVNDTVEVRADMTAPASSGTYVSNWAVYNNVGMPFCYIFIAITIP
jgi:hypothetical protein